MSPIDPIGKSPSGNIPSGPKESGPKVKHTNDEPSYSPPSTRPINEIRDVLENANARQDVQKKAIARWIEAWRAGDSTKLDTIISFILEDELLISWVRTQLNSNEEKQLNKRLQQ